MNTIQLIYPKTELRVLSHHEVRLLRDADTRTHNVVRRCCYAVLSAGSLGDDLASFEQAYEEFDIRFELELRGLVIELVNPPSTAFVDGQIIRGIREHLFSVLRDILYAQDSILAAHQFDLANSSDITNAVFHMLRNANALKPDRLPRLVVCWGGHSIPRHEYEYSKEVGYQLGLRGMDIGTGCGPGAMKGPMKGAAVGHIKQHIRDGRYVGITEPGIIATESPNPFVNELVILPDIEKRLESFVRMAHGIVIFPGGPGTAEELLYLLGILAHPDNQAMPYPLIITGPKDTEAYLNSIHEFIGSTLGERAQARYQLIIDDAEAVAAAMKQGTEQVLEYRTQQKDAYFYNWNMKIEPDFQHPFDPTHKAMAALELTTELPEHHLACNLRKVFSGIVAGNVKPDGRERVAKHGPYQLQGEKKLMQQLDQLLTSMVAKGRMKLSGEYEPCYRIQDL